MKDDQDVERYKAALKRSSFKISPPMIAVFLCIALSGVSIAGTMWYQSARKEKAAQEEARVEEQEKKEREARWEKERKLRKDRLSLIEAPIKTYAEIDATTLPEGPIDLAIGRRVLGIETIWQFADPDFRRRLKIPDEGAKPNTLFLPGDFEENQDAPTLAFEAKDVGTVILVKSITKKVGTYKGSDHNAKKRGIAGFGTLYTFVAFVVPERKVVARWRRYADPPTSIRTTQDGIPIGKSGFGRLSKDVYRADVDDLFKGRAPTSSDE